MTAVTREFDPRQPMLPAPGKSCGGCTACCHTVPVSEIKLAAYQRCPHLAGAESVKRGCSIYDRRPFSCRQWSCSWLIGDLPDRFRPDRLGIVIDPLPDMIRVEGVEIPVAQFWVMPGHEDDWKKPDVINLIHEMIELGVGVLWRMKDPDGGQLACAFWRDAKGAYQRSHTSKSNEELIGLSAPERLVRAQQLAQNKTTA